MSTTPSGIIFGSPVSSVIEYHFPINEVVAYNISVDYEEEYAVKEIGILGSFANNEASDESDIDLLVELHRPIGWNFFTLQIYLEGIFGRKVDLVTKNALKEQIKDRILAQVNYA